MCKPSRGEADESPYLGHAVEDGGRRDGSKQTGRRGELCRSSDINFRRLMFVSDSSPLYMRHAIRGKEDIYHFDFGYSYVCNHRGRADVVSCGLFYFSPLRG